MSDIALRFGARDDGLTAQFRLVNRQLDDLARQAKTITDTITGGFKVAGIGTIATSIAAAFKEAVSASLEFADTLEKTKAQTRFTVEGLQKLSFISGQVGVDFGSTVSAVTKLEKVLGGLEEGSDDANKALARLGLATDQFRQASPEDQFDEVARAIAGISSQNERVTVTTQLFGKSAADLLPIIVSIGEESAQLEEKLTLIGGPVGAAAIDKVDKLGDEMNTTALAAKSLATQVLAVFEPLTTPAQSKVQELIGALRFSLFGGDNEQVNLSDRIVKLQEFLNDPAPKGFFTNGAYIKAVREARDELEQLQRQQQALLGVGFAGVQPPLQKISTDVAFPGSPQFEETDDASKEREQLEQSASQQRLEFKAKRYEYEQDLAFKNAAQAGALNAKSYEDDIANYAAVANANLQVQTDAQKFFESVRQTFGLQEIKLEEIKDESILEIATSLFGQLASANSKLAKIQQRIALFQIIFSTAIGIKNAFANLPWPADIEAAALVALMGVTQFLKVKSTNYSPGSVSGTAPSFSGGSAVSSASNVSHQGVPGVTTPRSTTVHIDGFVPQESLDYLVERLRGLDRNVNVIR